MILLVTSPLARADSVPAGTLLEIRIQQPICSYSTPADARVSGVLIAPLTEGGRMLLPLGTTVEGSVIGVRRVGMGFVHETARIQLNFDRLILADGTTIPIHGRLTQVENSRENVDAQGHIQGIRSTGTLSHRTSGLLGTLAFGNPIAAIFATAASASVLRFSESEILLPAGTEMMEKLTAPIEVPQTKIELIPPIATSPTEQAALSRIVQQMPFRTATGKSNVPSDFTNLVFIGKQEALERAFAAAGWVVVDNLTPETTYATVRSVAENQGYRGAPMSTLLLAGQKPEYAYAKTLNTFSKRHHLRVWSSSLTWNGQTVWTSSSTHDIGIGFSKANKTFIHLIDTHIDNERAKVVNDFIFTGCVSGVQLVARPWIPKDAKNGTGEELITDGRIAVLQLDDCLAPHDENQGNQTGPLRVHGNRADRVTRQTVLTLRNNILRDNVGVMAYSGIHYAVEATKKKEGPTPVRAMEIGGNKYTIDRGFDREVDYASQPVTTHRTDEREEPSTRWTPPTVEIGLRGSWADYAGGNGGLIGFLFESTNPPGDNVVVVLANKLEQGWSLGGSVTIDSQKYLSHEFSFDHSFTKFTLGLGVIDNDTTSDSIESAFAFSESGLLTSEFAYNLLVNLRPRTARLRPYFAVGPSLQLMHLDDAPIKKAPGFFRLGLSNIGLLSAAYNFGSTPPLEGGGIFQPGFNYGAGIRYRVTPRWMLRGDYRETLTSQPDFWSKSKNDILGSLQVDEGYSFTLIGPAFNGAMRTQRASLGVSFTF